MAVGALIECTLDGSILLLKRSAQADFAPGIWGDITGRLRQFEEPEDGVRREVKEECGLDVEIIKPLKIFHIFRGSQTAENELVGIIYWCQTKDQKVKLSNEHDDFKWVRPDQALALVKDDGVRGDIMALIEERGGQTSKGWENFTNELNQLVKKIDYQPDVIVGIARGGIIPAVMLAKKLGVKDMYCLKVRKDESRTVMAEGFTGVNQKKVLLVEDMLETGRSLIAAQAYLESKGASVKTACLYTMPTTQVNPDYFLRQIEKVQKFPWE
ncbi:MAG: Purine phosphoribosyltransferase [Parcubacteria group bacterium GW2011_GWC2_44_22]|nr:MAG: Purine phosphoribosyltransferase [Parcubacteria group bacterium GW2011_GWC2_44_22]